VSQRAPFPPCFAGLLKVKIFCNVVSDAILKTAFESAECKEEGLVSSLLIYMGLLKV